MQTQGTTDFLRSTLADRRIGQVNQDLARVVAELTTGEKQDVIAATGGDTRRLYAIERDLTAVEARRTVIDLAIGRSEVTQNALGRIEEAGQSIGVDLKSAVGRGLISDADFEAGAARSSFEEVVGTLNTRFGDRTLFSGAAVNSAALASADDILTEITTRVAGAADANAVVNAIDDYFFNDPTGFAATGYIGSTQDAPATRLANGEEVGFALRADADEFRQVMAGLALSVVAVESSFAGATDEVRLNVFDASADRLLNSSSGIVQLRSDLGVAQERIGSAEVEAESERLFLSEARNRILAKDQFEAATEFTAIETQLQSTLALTARLSSLKLTNFLR